MSIDLNIHEIILQMVKKDMQFEELDLNGLLPIDTVYKGYGLYNGVQNIKFDPPREYGKSYEIEVNLDDDEERVEKLTKINQHIKEYNKWAADKNTIRDKEIYEKLPADGVVRSDAESGIEAKWYPSMREYQLWQFIVYKASPKEFRESVIEDIVCIINDEVLYKLKDRLSVKEFVIRFNRTLYEYLQIFIDEAKDNGVYDSDYIWFEPNKEFVRWFHNKSLIIDDHDPLIDVQKTNRFEPTETGLSPNSSWGSITISLVPSEYSPIPLIQIASPEYEETKTIDNYGFAHDQNIEKPNQLFETLEKFANSGGSITNDSPLRVQQTPVSRLRKHLQQLFGIESPPISNYTKTHGYSCNFHIQDARLNPESYKEAIKNINRSQHQQQDALEYTRDIILDPKTGEPIFPE